MVSINDNVTYIFNLIGAVSLDVVPICNFILALTEKYRGSIYRIINLCVP